MSVGVGVPTYSVAIVGADAHCKLTLPDGNVVTGKPAPNKQKVWISRYFSPSLTLWLPPPW